MKKENDLIFEAYRTNIATPISNIHDSFLDMKYTTAEVIIKAILTNKRNRDRTFNLAVTDIGGVGSGETVRERIKNKNLSPDKINAIASKVNPIIELLITLEDALSDDRQNFDSKEQWVDALNSALPHSVVDIVDRLSQITNEEYAYDIALNRFVKNIK